jgi:hypothetical protein
LTRQARAIGSLSNSPPRRRLVSSSCYHHDDDKDDDDDDDGEEGAYKGGQHHNSRSLRVRGQKHDKEDYSEEDRQSPPPMPRSFVVRTLQTAQVSEMCLSS